MGDATHPYHPVMLRRSLLAWVPAWVVAASLVACSSPTDHESRPPAAAVVQGLVTDEAGAPVAHAEVEVVSAGKPYRATTGSDGKYRLELDSDARDALPVRFFVGVRHDGYAADAIEVEKAASVLDGPASDTLATGGSAGAAPAEVEQFPTKTVRLRSKVTKARTLYTIENQLTHLGDSFYNTQANSQFQLPNASGVGQSWKFELPAFDAKAWQRAKIRLFARGIESPDTVSVNGKPTVGLGLTPEDGSAARVSVSVPLTDLVAGSNTLTLTMVGDENGPDDVELAYLELELDTPATVKEVVAGVCDTGAVSGLSDQLIAAFACVAADKISSIDPGWGIVLGENAYPYLQKAALDAAWAALLERPDTNLVLNSTLRTVAQQYLLQESIALGGCKKAAAPGNSQHEAGLAIDIQDHSGWKPALEAHGYKWFGASDPMHFTFQGEGAESLGGESVKAFQKLWNQNHPESLLTVNGTFDDATKTALEKSPAAGFDKDLDCSVP
ncbi:MAG: carboxypeptidase regulatory-like domain-containing protein [Polyangiaceae bacterium]